MTLKKIIQEVYRLCSCGESSDNMILPSVFRCLGDIERNKILPLRAAVPETVEAVPKNGYVYASLLSINDFYEIERVVCISESGYESSIDFFTEDENTVVLPDRGENSIYKIIYYPSPTKACALGYENVIASLPENIASLIPYYAVADIFISDEPQIASACGRHYNDGISAIKASALQCSASINTLYSSEDFQHQPFCLSENTSGSQSSFDRHTHTIPDIAGLEQLLEKKADGLDCDSESNMWYMTSGGRRISGPFALGSSASPAASDGISLIRRDSWINKSVCFGQDCSISFEFSALEGGISTGNGQLTLTVNGITSLSCQLTQGEHSLSIGSYLVSGDNTLNLNVTDIYGNSKSLIWILHALPVSLSSYFNGNAVYGSVINYTCIPIGNLPKTVYFILDGNDELPVCETVLISGEQITHRFFGLTHGSHTLRVYFTCEIDGSTVKSNELFYDLTVCEDGNDNPVITSIFTQSDAEQYTAVTIPYRVYSPGHSLSEITLSDKDTSIALTVDSEEKLWTVYPSQCGRLTLTIECMNITKTFNITVLPSSINVKATENDLALCLQCYGRSNSEQTPSIWHDSISNISSLMTDFNFVSDGWKSDGNGNSFLRICGDARVYVPYYIFGNDFKTSGKTIELEFSTSEVTDYETPIITCMNENVGLLITPSLAVFRSSQSEISTLFKENEHVRISFVIEKENESHLILMYINGVMSGAVQYPTGENSDSFRQLSPQAISFGSGDCTLDLYSIRIYDNNLTRRQILTNYISDTQNVILRKELYSRNDIYDDFGSISINKLPHSLPYIIFKASELPAYKGDKKSADIEFVNREKSEYSFSSVSAEMNVQGTSSQYYYRKNFKIKYKKGFTAGGETKEKYSINETAIPVSTFTYKADVASSEGANNVELVRLYNTALPFLHPPQRLNGNIRVGIDGFPVIAFHSDGNSTSFYAKMNFNNDKGTPEVFGFAQGDESWEMLNNTSDRTLFRSADFISDWTNDFEARYPEENTDTTKLAALCAFTASTNRDAATNKQLERSVTYDGTTYTTDSKAYRLARFKAEMETHFDLRSSLFYYLFTELFLMVDSRAKNAFPTYYASRNEGDGGNRWFWIPYDMDTALGINNEGSLVFGYSLEDTDSINGAYVYNGQNSVFWCNLRDAFRSELADMYRTLRSENKISYDIVEKMFENHQGVWSEAIFNEDSYSKCIKPLTELNDATYLPMLQGSKEQQRKWWLYNRIRYIDSKYSAGDALDDYIQMRGYAKSDVTLTPYSDIYVCIKYGSYSVRERGYKNNSYTLQNPLDNVNDTEIIIYSASALKSIGDLSGLKVGLFDAHMAFKLQSLKLGDADENYSNPNLTSLTVGNLTLLSEIDVRNCPNLVSAVDLSGCRNIEYIYFDGTGVTGVSLPSGGIIKELHLPGTITSLTVKNQPYLNSITLGGKGKIRKLNIENIPAEALDVRSVIMAMPENSEIHWTGFDLTLSNTDEIDSFLNKIISMFSYSLSGRISASSISISKYFSYLDAMTDIEFITDNFICDVLVDTEGKTMFDSSGNLISSADGGFICGLTGSQIDSFISKWR